MKPKGPQPQRRSAAWLAAAVTAGALAAACGAGSADRPAPAVSAAERSPTSSADEPPSTAATPASSPSSPVTAEPSAPPPAPEPCPPDMVYVDGVYCTRWQRRCLRSEQEPSNHLTICHRFAEEQRCVGERRRQRFCIDRYEYPSRQGAHPPVMVSAYDAAALCAEQGKRLCWESEWITACEGPRGLPFPYGYRRDSEQCNIDRPWRRPILAKVHSSNRAAQAPELARLDQSVPSGSMESCRSEYGVYDLTGNQDEWVLTERRRGTSEWVGLKGGNWHHVRNACRPMTTSHAAQWSYYFVSFRCCQAPDPAAAVPAADGDDGPPAWTPPPAPTPAPPAGAKLHRGWPPDAAGEQR